MVRTIDARRIVDEVGVDPAPHSIFAVERERDARGLGHAQIGPFANGLGTQVFGIDAQAIIGWIADLSVAFARRLHIGADAAEPDQIDRAFEDRRNQRGGFDVGFDNVERGTGFLRQFDRFGRARENAAAF